MDPLVESYLSSSELRARARDFLQKNNLCEEKVSNRDFPHYLCIYQNFRLKILFLILLDFYFANDPVMKCVKLVKRHLLRAIPILASSGCKSGEQMQIIAGIFDVLPILFLHQEAHSRITMNIKRYNSSNYQFRDLVIKKYFKFKISKKYYFEMSGEDSSLGYTHICIAKDFVDMCENCDRQHQF